MIDPQNSYDPVPVEISLLDHAEGLDLPTYATTHSAGMDLRAAIAADEVMSLGPGERSLVPTGLKIGLPAGFEAQVRPRSGLAVKYGVTVLNSPGTIDADYRGEVKVILVNHGAEPFEIRRGDRIAQMIVVRHATIRWERTDDLSSTERGEGGFGHTGH